MPPPDIVHIAGPVRRGSRQVTQRCIRCGFPLVVEASGVDDLTTIGFDPGTAVRLELRGAATPLDEVMAQLPQVRLCQKQLRKRRIKLD